MNLTRRNLFKFGAGAFAVVTAANIMPIKALLEPILILPKPRPTVYLVSDHHFGMDFGSPNKSLLSESIYKEILDKSITLSAVRNNRRSQLPLASGELRVLANGDVIIGV